MNPTDLEEYLNKIIKPTLEEYAKENNTTVEELLKEIIKQNNSKNEKKNKKSK